MPWPPPIQRVATPRFTISLHGVQQTGREHGPACANRVPVRNDRSTPTPPERRMDQPEQAGRHRRTKPPGAGRGHKNGMDGDTPITNGLHTARTICKSNSKIGFNFGSQFHFSRLRHVSAWRVERAC
jgi:hypothetical protein